MFVPKVSVIMPVYNGMPYLPEAVKSILNQQFRDFELIIVNDCSTDASTNYLDSLNDSRIVRLENKTNQGVCPTLQKGLEAASGEYIARLDSDDIADPGRLQIQVDFLMKNPSYGLIGSSYRSISNVGIVSEKREEFTDDLELRWKFLFKNPIVHSTVLFRQSLIKKYGLKYRLPHGEDYDLWSQMLQHTKSCVLKDPLISYRVHHESWTYTKKDEQVSARLQQSFNAMNNLLKSNKENALSWDSFVSFSNWRSGVGEDRNTAYGNTCIELRLLKCFATEFGKHPQLYAFKRKMAKRIFTRSKKMFFLNPLIAIKVLKILTQ